MPDATHATLALGFLAAWLLTERLARRMEEGPGPGERSLLFLLGGLAFLIGSRLGRALEVFGPAAVLARPLASWGEAPGTNGLPGLLLALAAVAAVARLRGLALRSLLDLLMPGILLALAAGRVGCLLDGHCLGLPTRLPWGVAGVPGHYPWSRVHPTPAYEALAYASLSLGSLRIPSALRGRRAGAALAGLGLSRFAVEMIRTNPRGLLGLTQAQACALLLLTAGLALLAAAEAGALRACPARAGASASSSRGESG